MEADSVRVNLIVIAKVVKKIVQELVVSKSNSSEKTEPSFLADFVCGGWKNYEEVSGSR